MDGLSAAASVIAVIQITQAIGAGLKNYYEGVRDAREEIQKFYMAIKSLEAVLKLLQELLALPSKQKSLCEALFNDQAGPIKQCQGELDRISSELGNSSAHGKTRQALQSLMWPFKKNDIEKRITMLERSKSTLSLGIGMESLSKTRDVFDIAQDIYSDIREAREEKNRQIIIAWLRRGVPDPSKEHNEARSKHEQSTGSWLLESYDFKAWVEGRNSFLWLNGNAGAGKSVMCSSVIDYVQKQYEKEPSSAIVYWYFTFTDAAKQDVSNAMCSLITDICSNRRDTPEELQNAFRRNNFGQQKPPLRDLIAILQAVMYGFQDVYIVLDALDECPKAGSQRETLLEILHEIHSWQLPCLHLLTTSRREVDIQESLNYSNDISVQGPQVEQDIVKYLEHRLEHHKYSSWKPSLKADVKELLAKRADGMFRLVALQLDALSRIRVESKIRAAVHTLPRTLEAFYDRMLQEIEDPDEQEYARRAFLWIAYSARLLTLEELAEAVIILPNESHDNFEDDRFLECQDLLRIIPSGLISVLVTPRGDEDDWLFNLFKVSDCPHPYKRSNTTIQFAHFSVEEYLFSSRTSMTTPKYQISRHAVDTEILCVCLSYLLHVGSEDPEISRDTMTNYPLLTYAAAFCTHHIQKLGSEHLADRLVSLALEFLRHDAPPWRMWTAITFDDGQYAVDGKFKDPINTLSRPRSLPRKAILHPITWICVAGLNSLLTYLVLDSDLDINKVPTSKYLGHPLYAAARAGQRQIVDTLLANGVKVNRGKQSPLVAACAETRDVALVDSLLQAGAHIDAVGDIGKNALQAASHHDDSEQIVALLLNKGANVNSKDGDFGSAIQIATYFGHKHIVRRLAEAHADVNAEWGLYGSTLQNAVLREDPDILQLLVAAGLDVNTVVDIGKGYSNETTALRFAVTSLREGHVRAILRSQTLRVKVEEWAAIYFNAEKMLLPRMSRYLWEPSDEKLRSDFKIAASVRDMLGEYGKMHGLELPDSEARKEIDVLSLIEHVVAPVGSEWDSVMTGLIRHAVVLAESKSDAEISSFLELLESDNIVA